MNHCSTQATCSLSHIAHSLIRESRTIIHSPAYTLSRPSVYSSITCTTISKTTLHIHPYALLDQYHLRHTIRWFVSRRTAHHITHSSIWSIRPLHALILQMHSLFANSFIRTFLHSFAHSHNSAHPCVHCSSNHSFAHP